MTNDRMLRVTRWFAVAGIIILAGGFVRWMLLGKAGVAALCAVLAVILALVLRWKWAP